LATAHHKKCLFSTRKVTVLFNHAPLACLPPDESDCRPLYLDAADAQLSHYRDDCTYNVDPQECADYHTNLTDDTEMVWRYREALVRSTSLVLAQLRQQQPAG
jgi:hypothetical protein